MSLRSPSIRENVGKGKRGWMRGEKEGGERGRDE